MANICFYDLEVSPARGYFYPPLYQANIMKVDKYQTLMSFSWGFFEEDKKLKVKHCNLTDFQARFKADRWDDTDVVKRLHEVMQDADTVIVHNGVNFDNKMANTYFLKHGLDPLPDYKTIDTLKSARRHFRFASNKLDEICNELGIKGKTKIKVGDLWYDLLVSESSNIKKTSKLLKEYNDQDIYALNDIYIRLRPYITNHPNIAVMGDPDGCPVCGSHNHQYNGLRYTSTMTYRRVQCTDCHSWYKERVADKDLQNKPFYTR